jgi:hypothetical protein
VVKTACARTGVILSRALKLSCLLWTLWTARACLSLLLSCTMLRSTTSCWCVCVVLPAQLTVVSCAAVLQDCPVVVLVNKCDAPGALPLADVSAALDVATCVHPTPLLLSLCCFFAACVRAVSCSLALFFAAHLLEESLLCCLCRPRLVKAYLLLLII